MGILETMIDIPAEHEKNVFGQFDIFAKKIERALHVTLIARNGKVKVLGEEKNVERAQQVLSQLTELSRRGNTIQEQNVDYALSLTMEDSAEDILTIDKDLICHTLQGKPIKPKTLGQKKYVDAGAIVMNPNCSVCWGSCQGVIGENEVLISTGTRNFKGRAGHPSSKVYLGSAATVTASAIAGEIALASDV